MVILGEDSQLSLDVLRGLIPKNHLCYFIEDVVNQIDCSEDNVTFIDVNSDVGYPCKLLLRLILMSIFDGVCLLMRLKREQILILFICIWRE